jgi:hypothetical protein
MNKSSVTANLTKSERIGFLISTEDKYRLSSHSTSTSSFWNDSLLELAVDIDSKALVENS